MKVRRATHTDIEQIAKIHVETWQDAYKDLMPAELLDSLAIDQKIKLWKSLLSSDNEDTIAFVATEGESIIGFTSIGKSRDPEATEEIGEIYTIYVDHNHYRKGAGKLLLDAVQEKLIQLGFSKATLWVLETNTQGRSFYEKNGWQLTEEKKTEERDSYKLDEVKYQKIL